MQYKCQDLSLLCYYCYHQFSVLGLKDLLQPIKKQKQNTTQPAFRCAW